MSKLLAIVTTTGLDKAQEGAGYGTTPLPELIGSIIYILLSLLGVLFLALFIYGGVTWMTSLGNAKSVEKAKSILVAATVGLLIVLTSYAITNFVIVNLGQATIDQNSTESPWDAVPT